MKLALGALLWLTLCSCNSSGIGRHRSGDLMGLDSFALAARYGKPVNYQHQGDQLQLNYGGESAGCRVILLIDEHQRVAGWASTGAKCGAQPDRAGAPCPIRAIFFLGVPCILFI